MIKQVESDFNSEEIDDQKRFLLSQKIEVLKSLSLN